MLCFEYKINVILSIVNTITLRRKTSLYNKPSFPSQKKNKKKQACKEQLFNNSANKNEAINILGFSQYGLACEYGTTF